MKAAFSPLAGAVIVVGLLCALCWHPASAQQHPAISPLMLQPWSTTTAFPLEPCGTGAANSLPLYTLVLQQGAVGFADTLWLALKGHDGACQWVTVAAGQ